MSGSLSADAIKQRARQLGFDLCGVAPALAFPELSFLPEWLARGYAGEMEYMEKSAATPRRHPQLPSLSAIGHRHGDDLQHRSGLGDHGIRDRRSDAVRVAQIRARAGLSHGLEDRLQELVGWMT